MSDQFFPVLSNTMYPERFCFSQKALHVGKATCLVPHFLGTCGISVIVAVERCEDVKLDFLWICQAVGIARSPWQAANYGHLCSLSHWKPTGPGHSECAETTRRTSQRLLPSRSAGNLDLYLLRHGGSGCTSMRRSFLLSAEDAWDKLIWSYTSHPQMRDMSSSIDDRSSLARPNRCFQRVKCLCCTCPLPWGLKQNGMHTQLLGIMRLFFGVAMGSRAKAQPNDR